MKCFLLVSMSGQPDICPVQGICAFQSWTGFYRGFSRNLSAVAHLLNERVKTTWLPACQRALENIEQVVLACPVLVDVQTKILPVLKQCKGLWWLWCGVHAKWCCIAAKVEPGFIFWWTPFHWHPCCANRLASFKWMRMLSFFTDVGWTRPWLQLSLTI